MKYPTISVAITTFNSEKTLFQTLEGVRKQNYPHKDVEILIIDAGSKDQTRSIAEKFGCKIIDNVYTFDTPGKYLALNHAKGKYLLHLDSDEIIKNPNSFKMKIEAFTSDKKIKGVMSSGYENPKNFPAINRYINEFGDPFSYFIYRQTINYHFFIMQLKQRYKIINETDNFLVFDFSRVQQLPLLELSAMSSMIDLSYFRNEVPDIKNNPALIPHYFYILSKNRNYIAITKNDEIVHYSSTTLKRYLNKISWRVKNNIFNETNAEAGFVGRDVYQPFWFRIKKFLFIPYSFSIIFPLIDSVWLSLTRADWIFLIHPIMCIYASVMILYYYVLYLAGIKPHQKGYGS